MVDRDARDRYAEVLRGFLRGEITNFEYERCFDAIVSGDRGDDAATYEIWKVIWYLYDDLREHYLTDAHAPSDEARQLADRCLLFLASDCPYEYEPAHFAARWKLWNLITLGLYGRLRKVHPNGGKEGERVVWPFFRSEDSREAQTDPKVMQRCLAERTGPIVVPRQPFFDRILGRRVTAFGVSIAIVVFLVAVVAGPDLVYAMLSWWGSASDGAVAR